MTRDNTVNLPEADFVRVDEPNRDEIENVFYQQERRRGQKLCNGIPSSLLNPHAVTDSVAGIEHYFVVRCEAGGDPR